jgi:D-inositol-3-phosphate glycosyltransferase
VVHSILPHLADRYAVHHFQIDWHAPDASPRQTAGGWRVLPNRVPGDIFGAEQLPAILADVCPRIVWIVHDYYLYSAHKAALDAHRPHPRVAVYCPIDGDRARPDTFANSAGIDRLILYTPFGRDVVEQALGGQVLGGGARPVLDVIPHGLDCTTFKPFADDRDTPDRRRRARRVLFPDRSDLDEAFIVLNANRNTIRKRIDLTIDAFARFARDKPANVKLYLHMGWQEGYDIARLVAEYGIADRVLTTSRDRWHPEVNDHRLNLIYNAADVGVNTATGEGWGLVAFEHAATRAAQIVPRHSACAALWEDAALLVEPVASVHVRGDYVDHRVVTAGDVANALDTLYRDPVRRADLAARAYARATDPEIAWPRVAPRWDRLFTELLRESIPTMLVDRDGPVGRHEPAPARSAAGSVAAKVF